MSWSRSIKARGSAAVSALLAQAGLATLLLVVPAPALAQGSVEDLYQRATQALSKMDVEGACELFQQVERQSPGYKDVPSSMRASCAAASKLHEAEETLFTECNQLFNQRQFDDAKIKCANVLDKSNKLRHPRYRDQAAQILKSIDAKVAEAEREKRVKVPVKTAQELGKAGETSSGPTGGKIPAPGPSEVSGNEELLKVGLRAYFNSDYAQAENSLTRYLNSHGAKSALAYFFRGAAHGSRYFLSGEKDSEQRSQALADFRDANIQRLGSKPSEKFVPPKILALYQEAISTGSQ